MRTSAVGVDVGGTKIAAGIVDDAANVAYSTVVSTPEDPRACVAALVSVVETVLSHAAAAPAPAVGVGLPGLVDRAGLFRYGPNFPLRDTDVGAVLEPLGLPLWFGNDANAAAWAEYLFGAGQRCGDMVMVTLGTGIGGGIILGGAPFGGAHGYAGEFGHLVFAGDGAPGGDGTDAHWEYFASGSALDSIASAAAEGPGGAAILAEAGGDVAAVRGGHLTSAASGGDATALAAMDSYSARVAAGIAGLVQCFDPARVVVGGGVSAAGDVLFGPLSRHTRRLLSGAQHRPEVPVVPAALGPDAGMIGAALMAMESAG